MASLGENISNVLSRLPEGVRLVAVSKYHPEDAIRQAYDCGQRIFGESHEQELRHKVAALPDDIEWHFIGHLQTNKVKYIAPYIYMVEAVDSLKLLREINKQAARNGRVIRCLLELHIAEEATKYGFSLDECRKMLAEGEKQIASEFQTAYDFFNEVKAEYFADDDNFKERSWGMSDDYAIAVNHGSTLVRVGSAIFGPRVY